MKLAIITVSVRPGRIGLPITNWFAEQAYSNTLFDYEVIDLESLNLPMMDEPMHPRLQQYEHEHTKSWSKLIDRFDAYVFVNPEYDYSMPASLVNAVTYLSNEWKYKPVGFVSYGGVSAGTRSAQQAKQLITAVNMMPIAEAVNIPFAAKYIDDNGIFIGTEELSSAAKNMLDELAKWAQALLPLHKP